MFSTDKITEIFCICDEFSKEFDQNIKNNAIDTPKYRGCGKRKPNISDAEIITILICFHSNSFRNFKHYYNFYVLTSLQKEFPNAPSYSRFVSLIKRVGIKMAFFIKLCLSGECTGISFVDSTCIPVCHNKRINRNRLFEGIATIGKSSMGWYFGFKLHLLCNERGEILNFVLTKANVSDCSRNVFKVFEKDIFGKLYADKGYISSNLFNMLWSQGIHIVTGIRSNMKTPVSDKKQKNRG